MNKYLCFLFLGFQLVACNSSTDSKIDTYIQQIRSRAMKDPEPIQPLENLASFHYPDSEARPDPFKQDLVRIENHTRDKQPLEYFPIATLSFVGVMKKELETRALISQINGELFSIKVGDFMGENEGEVIEIKENSMRVEEKIIVAGKLTKKIKEIYLNLAKLGARPNLLNRS